MVPPFIVVISDGTTTVKMPAKSGVFKQMRAEIPIDKGISLMYNADASVRRRFKRTPIAQFIKERTK